MNFKIASFTTAAALLVLGCALLVSGDVSHLPLANSNAPQSPPVTEVCLGCICEAISGCNRTLTCGGDVCGLFRITWAYWSDSGKPTLQGEDPKSQTANSNAPQSPPLTEACLGCICEAITGCNTALTCEGDVCGVFRITWSYWSDAGKPTVQGEDPKSLTAYPNCANDPYCAARCVKNYVAKFGQDCNDDGVINCYDHAAIHLLGGNGCSGGFSLY